jgi:hypothetical protein
MLEPMFETRPDVERSRERMHTAYAAVGRAHLTFLRYVAVADAEGAWEDDGARDTAHWLAIEFGLSGWKARRWIVAAHVIETLPAIRAALLDGTLSIDKVVELTRFAAPENEERLVRWARDVSCGAIRRRADVEAERARDDLLEIERSRRLSWWYSDEGARFEIQGDMPAAQGAIVARAPERVADILAEMPDDADEDHTDARRADALVALCSARLAADHDADRATVVVHVRSDGNGAGESEDGAILHPAAVDRLLCNARMQVVTEGEDGEALGIGRMSRQPTAAMLRQIRYRDRECRFPGCGARRFTEAHHVVWWRNGGRTDLENLVLICSFHHRLVHEHGWRLDADATSLRWFRPDGTRYRAGPSREPPMLHAPPSAPPRGRPRSRVPALV